MDSMEVFKKQLATANTDEEIVPAEAPKQALKQDRAKRKFDQITSVSEAAEKAESKKERAKRRAIQIVKEYCRAKSETCAVAAVGNDSADNETESIVFTVVVVVAVVPSVLKPLNPGDNTKDSRMITSPQALLKIKAEPDKKFTSSDLMRELCKCLNTDTSNCQGLDKIFMLMKASNKPISRNKVFCVTDNPLLERKSLLEWKQCVNSNLNYSWAFVISPFKIDGNYVVVGEGLLGLNEGGIAINSKPENILAKLKLCVNYQNDNNKLVEVFKKDPKFKKKGGSLDCLVKYTSIIVTEICSSPFNTVSAVSFIILNDSNDVIVLYPATTEATKITGDSLTMLQDKINQELKSGKKKGDVTIHLVCFMSVMDILVAKKLHACKAKKNRSRRSNIVPKLQQAAKSILMRLPCINAILTFLHGPDHVMSRDQQKKNSSKKTGHNFVNCSLLIRNENEKKDPNSVITTIEKVVEKVPSGSNETFEEYVVSTGLKLKNSLEKSQTEFDFGLYNILPITSMQAAVDNDTLSCERQSGAVRNYNKSNHNDAISNDECPVGSCDEEDDVVAQRAAVDPNRDLPLESP